MTSSLFQQSEMPRVGSPVTLDQLREWICDDAPNCPHAERCAEQLVGTEAVCFAIRGPPLHPREANSKAGAGADTPTPIPESQHL